MTQQPRVPQHRLTADAARDFVAREGMYGWRLAKRLALALVVLVFALILASFDVPGAALTAAAALIVFLAIMFVGPWLGPRRRL